MRDFLNSGQARSGMSATLWSSPSLPCWSALLGPSATHAVCEQKFSLGIWGIEAGSSLMWDGSGRQQGWLRTRTFCGVSALNEICLLAACAPWLQLLGCLSKPLHVRATPLKSLHDDLEIDYDYSLENWPYSLQISCCSSQLSFLAPPQTHFRLT